MQVGSTSKDDLICKNYKKQGRTFQEIRGIRMTGLVSLLEWCGFSDHVIGIDRNYREIRFEITMCTSNKKNGKLIDHKAVDAFTKFWGHGFHIILLDRSDKQPK